MSVDALHDDSPSGDGSRRLLRIGRLGMPENMAFFVPWRDFWEAFGRSVTGGAEPLEDTFARLATQWKEAAVFLSNPDEIKAAPGYREIVALGSDALPFILSELREDPFHWLAVLTDITHIYPFEMDAAGDIRKMTDAWLAWGEKQGIV